MMLFILLILFALFWNEGELPGGNNIEIGYKAPSGFMERVLPIEYTQ